MTNFVAIKKKKDSSEINIFVAVDSIRTIEPYGVDTLITFKCSNEELITSENIKEVSKKIAFAMPSKLQGKQQ